MRGGWPKQSLGLWTVNWVAVDEVIDKRRGRADGLTTSAAGVLQAAPSIIVAGIDLTLLAMDRPR